MLNTRVVVVGLTNTLLQHATAYTLTGLLFRNMETKMQKALSDLAKIEVVYDHPIDHFRAWHDEARKYNPRMPNAACLATTSKDCQVSARTIIIREFDNDGFVIVTDSRSRKINNIENAPHVAMCFFWFYVQEEKQEVSKQVRVEGVMRKLKREEIQHIYDREPLYCKIRSHLCTQGSKVEWTEHKKRHDMIVDSVCRNENDLPLPDHFVGYKLLPTMMEFYFARDHFIADRILYRKLESQDSWKYDRIAA